MAKMNLFPQDKDIEPGVKKKIAQHCGIIAITHFLMMEFIQNNST